MVNMLDYTTEGDYNDMLANGITVIADSKAFTSDLYKSGLMTPLQAYIEYNESYTEKSPYDPETFYSIRKINMVMGHMTLSLDTELGIRIRVLG
jgi:hypothetical protein